MAGMAATAANKAVAKPKPARKPPAANNVNSVNSVSSSEEEGSGIGYWLQHPTGWIVIGAVVLILLALLLLLLQRRRSAAGGDKATPAAPAKSGRGEEGHGDGHDAGPEASAPIEEGIPHEAEAGIENATAEGRAGHHDEDLGIATYIGGPSLDVNKVDALDEADLHLGFGDYTKAAASLREAIAREPSRVELRRKLLEVLFAAGDGESFAAEAEAYRPHADAADWEAVAVMGRQLRPNDDLFAAAETASAGARVSTEQPSTEGAGTETLGGDFLDIDLDKLSVDRGDNPDQSEFERTMDELSTFIETYVPASTDTPVSLQLPPEEREPAPAGQAVDEPGTAAPVQEADDEPLAAPEDEPLEFSLDEGDLPSPTEGEPKAPAEIDWDEDAGGDGENLVDTKLDLARAYIDMGDSDSARSVLEEVIDEGDETQSGEARRLMESLD